MLSRVFWCRIIVCWLRWRSTPPEERRRQPRLSRNNQPVSSFHLVNNVRRSRTGRAAWHAMKRSWHKSGRAPRRGRSHATAASADRPFAAGSTRAAFRNEGRAVIQARWISIKRFFSGAGNRAAIMPLNSRVSCVSKDSPANPVPFATGSKNIAGRKRARRNNPSLPPHPRGHPRGKSHGCC